MSSPATLGPATRFRLSPVEFMVMAFEISSSLTSAGMMDWRVGKLKAKTAPCRRPTTASCQTVIRPACTSTAVAAASSARQVWTMSSIRFLSARSTSAPAISEKRAIGMPEATATRPSAVLEPEIS